MSCRMKGFYAIARKGTCSMESVTVARTVLKRMLTSMETGTINSEKVFFLLILILLILLFGGKISHLFIQHIY